MKHLQNKWIFLNLINLLCVVEHGLSAVFAYLEDAASCL